LSSAKRVLKKPNSFGQLARAERDAEMEEAHARRLRSRIEMAQALDNLDPQLRGAVMRNYGDCGIEALVDIARRAEAGPTQPRELNLAPVEDPEAFPTPPEPGQMGPPEK
jgi:hypothetical protein